MNLWGFPAGAAAALERALDARRARAGSGELTLPDIVDD